MQKPTEHPNLPIVAPNSLILGVDPGTAVTGWGIVQLTTRGARFVGAGVIRTKSADPLESRLLTLSEGLQIILDTHQPVIAAVEEPFFGENARSALVLGQARGALLLTLARKGLPVSSYSPREVKRAAVGNGAATKEQVAFMIGRILGLSPTPDGKPFPNDATDALAIALCHALRCRISN